MDAYLPHFNLLINSAYWDKRYPRLVTERLVKRFFKSRKLRLELIGDLTCDVGGTIEITKKTTTPGQPTFVYDPSSGKITDGFEGKGVAVLAVDNLPCEFPRDASLEFSGQIRDYVYQLASHAASDVTNHAALPRELRGAVVTEKGRLTPNFQYLGKYIRDVSR